MKINTNVLKIFLIISVFTGCYYKKEELVYPTNPPILNCDTSVVRFTNMQTLINNNCSVCHTGNTTISVPLTSYASVSAQAEEILRRVLLPTNHPSHMPLGGTTLPACEIAKIRTWIRNGKPQ